MLKLNKSLMAVTTLALLINAGTAMAGRYGDAEIRHQQSVAKVQASGCERNLTGTQVGGQVEQGDLSDVAISEKRWQLTRGRTEQ